MHYWNVFAFDVEHHNVSCSDRCLIHPKEQQVTTVECWLHTLTSSRASVKQKLPTPLYVYTGAVCCLLFAVCCLLFAVDVLKRVLVGCNKAYCCTSAYLSTTTIGLSVPVATDSDFQMANAEARIIKKLSTCNVC
jgi:hypothetical protein